jgi:hypothetical protein
MATKTGRFEPSLGHQLLVPLKRDALVRDNLV